jgi:hypothetical protein
MAPVVSRLVASPHKFAEGASIKYSYRDKRFWGMLEPCEHHEDILVFPEGRDRSFIYRSEAGHLLGRQRQASGEHHISYLFGLLNNNICLDRLIAIIRWNEHGAPTTRPNQDAPAFVHIQRQCEDVALHVSTIAQRLSRSN